MPELKKLPYAESTIDQLPSVEKTEQWLVSTAAEAWQKPTEHWLALTVAAGALGAMACISRGSALRPAAMELMPAARSVSMAIADGAENVISHVPTPGAFVRPWVAADQAACDAVARATRMGTYIRGGTAWVLETPQNGVVGYTSLAPKCWADIAVMPQFRGNTGLLADTALGEMRALGGKWYTNARESTGLGFMKRLESSGAIKITRDQTLFGADPYHAIDFTVL